MKTKSILVTVLTIFLLTGCTSTVRNSSTMKEMNNQYTVSTTQRYVVKVGDRLRISFYGTRITEAVAPGQPDVLSDILLVRPDGKVQFQLIEGEVKVAGLTVDEIASRLREMYKRYLKYPQFSVNIVEFAERYVYVGGEVTTPQALSYTGSDMTVLSAITAAGYFTLHAQRKHVVLIRSRGLSEKPLIISLNMKDVINGQDLSQDLHLLPEDIVVVP